MEPKFYSRENLKFLLHEVLKVQDLCTREKFKEHSWESFEMMLESADSLATNHLRPILIEMDRNQPYLENGKIKVHPKMRSLMKKFGDDGWISLTAPHEMGGLQVPFTILESAVFIMTAANFATVTYPFLTNGAAHLIESFASDELKQTYIPHMYSGDWQGTMALTEPGAGSSLSDVVTSAKPTGNGDYLVKGQKIFISCGDHDGCDNVIHLMLARIEGAPAGTKGISLFVVPQKRLDDKGNLVFNDVNTVGVFHKMGFKGSPIAHLMMGEKNDCHAFLVGEAHKGLSYMFQLMNEARIGVGLQATAIASAAYYNALEYTHVRTQGRKPGEKDPSKPPMAIINHADVKRMLLFQKSIVEGSLGLILEAALYFDKWVTSEGEEKENNFLLLELLTPIAKTYPAEMSILTTSAGMQCFGGYGYTTEFMAELFFRETRIHTIHEGTSAIHGMDLLGRKVMMQNGKPVQLLMQVIAKDIEAAKKYESMKAYADVLSQKLLNLQETTMHLVGLAQRKGAEIFLADANLYLEMFGIITLGWQWLKQGTKAEELKAAGNKTYTTEFLNSKMNALQYFFEYEIPKTEGLATRLKSANHVTVETKPEEIV